MKIALLTNKDLPSCLALNQLLPALTAHDLGLFVSAQVGSPNSNSTIGEGLELLRFYEQQLFNDILFPLLEASHGEKTTGLLSFNRLAALTGRPLQELNRINEPQELALLQRFAPDLILSIRYGAILKDAVLALPTIGVLNLHSGLLPEYKGVMATFRALLNGDSTIGTTLHWIDDSRIDCGRIIGTTSMPVSRGQSYLWHVLALYQDGCRLTLDTVRQLSTGETVLAYIQPQAGNYYSFPGSEELDQFRKLGWQLVNPKDIESITNLCMREKPQ